MIQADRCGQATPTPTPTMNSATTQTAITGHVASSP